MKEQILKIIEAEGLTPAKFADEIGVQRSSISHIISGRNKPSYDFIIKIIDRFRGINSEWLLTGKGSMIKSSEMENNAKKTLFEMENMAPTLENQSNKTIDYQKSNKPVNTDITEHTSSNHDNITTREKSTHVEFTNVNTDSFILVFYKDGTYKRYSRRD